VRWLDFERYPDHLRLDLLAPDLDPATRFEIALEAVAVAFDIFYSGYAHRDFHTKNLFWVDEQLKVIDFEELGQYGKDARPPFPESFDLVGAGLPDSGFGGSVMCYVAQTVAKIALQEALGIPLEEVLIAFREKLKHDLKIANRRGDSQHGAISEGLECHLKLDCSFELPFFTVTPDEAERDSVQRINLLKIDDRLLAGKRLLVLGGAPAGMLFSLQQFKPAFSLGVARAPDEVEAASRIAAYCGLHNVQFIHDGAGPLAAGELGGPFDVVFYAVNEADAKAPARDAQWLNALTRDVLYLEGASTSNPQTVRATLQQCGFRSVSCLGTGVETGQPKSACQPIFVARKS
jgi:hypothetical protein